MTIGVTLGVSILGAIIYNWLVDPFFSRSWNRITDKKSNFPSESRSSSVYLVSYMDDLRDKLDNHNKYLNNSKNEFSSESPLIDIQPYRPIQQLEPEEHIQNDLTTDYSDFREDIDSYNQLIRRYSDLRNGLKNSLKTYLLENSEHLFRNINVIRNEETARYYSTTILDVGLPKIRRGGMDSNIDVIYCLIPGIRAKERFQEDFEQLRDMADNIQESNEEISRKLGSIREQYVKGYEMSESEIAQHRNQEA